MPLFCENCKKSTQKTYERGALWLCTDCVIEEITREKDAEIERLKKESESAWDKFDAVTMELVDCALSYQSRAAAWKNCAKRWKQHTMASLILGKWAVKEDGVLIARDKIFTFVKLPSPTESKSAQNETKTGSSEP